jgi:hypothetical protein
MFTNLRLFLSVLAVLAVLAACSPVSPDIAATPSPSTVLETSPTSQSTDATPPSPGLAGFDCQNIQEISIEECQGLVALYESTNGDTWADNSGWLADKTPCNWIGVTCQQQHVVEVQLAYNQLSGSLPPEIGNLTHLRQLYLDGNQLNGPVPAEIGSLSRLQVLRLSANQFNTIPTELSNLSNLLELDLSRNQINGNIPSGLGNLSILRYLGLNTNQFTGEIPSELGDLTNLSHLNLANNQLSGPIPAALGDLASLNELHLSHNQLTGTIPAEIVNLTGLYWLDLSYNQLTGEVPQALADAPIADIRLWGNQLEGTIFTSEQAVTLVDYQGVHYEYDSTLAESVWPEIAPAKEGTSDAPGWLVWPEHVRFTFAGSQEAGDFLVSGMGPFVHPQLMIFPAKTFGTLSEFAQQEVENLQALLEARPPAPEQQLPLLPLINAAQVFHAQAKYLDFQNGSGVRFITQYSQDVFPIVNQNIFYTFQGLTRDGSYYVVAAFPIDAEGLPDEPLIEDWEAFSAGYQDYLTETTGQLDALAAGQFEPNLDMLDAFVQSLVVDVP